MDDQQNLFDRAAEAHARWCERQSGLPDTPSRELSEVRKQIVVLRNVRGLMGRYRVGRDGRLRRAGSRDG